MKLYRCVFTADPELLDALSACLFEAGAQGLEESPDALTTYVPDRAQVDVLLAAFADFQARVRVLLPEVEFSAPGVDELESDWQEAWLQALEPLVLPGELVLRPTTKSPAPAGEDTLWFEPTQSFGAGNHPTTVLAAEALRAHVQSHPGLELLDLGVGNGVLSLVALRFGLAHAWGVDIDPVAADAFARNAAINGYAERVTALAGEVGIIERNFPLVVANIDPDTLIAMAEQVLARVAPGGALWLTGILEERAGEVRAAYASPEFSEQPARHRGDWILLEYTRRS